MGVGTRTGIDDGDYQVPLRFTGKLDKPAIRLNDADEKLLQQKTRETKNKAQ